MTKKKILFLALLLTLLLAGCSAGDVSPSGTRQPLVLCFYHFNPCESCPEFEEFRVLFDDAVSDLRDEVSYILRGINGFQDNQQSFNAACDALGIPQEQRAYRMLVCGDRWIAAGLDEPGQLRDFLAGCLSQSSGLPAVSSAPARESASPAPWTDPAAMNFSPEDSVVLFFKTDGCAKCEEVREYLDTLPAAVSPEMDGQNVPSKITVIEYSLLDDRALALLESLFTQYEVPASDRKVPIVFVSGGYLSGQEAVEEGLMPLVSEGKALNFSLRLAETQEPALSWRDLPAIFAAGLLGGLNPCSISMLFFLMSLLLARQARVLGLGFTYIAARMVTYFLIGTVLSSLLAYVGSALFAGVTRIVNTLLAAVLLALALLNLYDALAAKKEKYGRIRLQLPLGLRRFNHRMIEKTVSGKGSLFLFAAVFALGVFISMGEFLCTGQIYLATILYLLQKTTAFTPVLYACLGVYGAAMAIPPAALTLLIYRGRRVLALSEWVRRHMLAVKLLNGALLLLIAIYMLMKTY